MGRGGENGESAFLQIGNRFFGRRFDNGKREERTDR